MTDKHNILKYKGILFKHIRNHGDYAISQCGLILDRNGLLKPSVGAYGRLLVPYLEADPEWLDIVVWRAWVGLLGNNPRNMRHKLCHVDGDISNNHLNNLHLIDKDGNITPAPAIIATEDVIFKEPDLTTYSPKPTKRDKLTADDVRDIRQLAISNAGFRKGELAKKLGIDVRTLRRVLRLESWKDVK